MKIYSSEVVKYTHNCYKSKQESDSLRVRSTSMIWHAGTSSGCPNGRTVLTVPITAMASLPIPRNFPFSFGLLPHLQKVQGPVTLHVPSAIVERQSLVCRIMSCRLLIRERIGPHAASGIPHNTIAHATHPITATAGIGIAPAKITLRARRHLHGHGHGHGHGHLHGHLRAHLHGKGCRDRLRLRELDLELVMLHLRLLSHVVGERWVL